MGVLFAAIAALIGLRLIWVQVVDSGNILDRADVSREVVQDVQPRRGTIYDRNGTVLATTIDTTNIACHPRMVEGDNAQLLANTLVELYGGEAQDYLEQIDKDENFVYLHKNANKEEVQVIKDLGIEGMEYESSTQRVYPCGNVAAQVLGTVDADGNAQSGIELYYNEILGGVPGKKITAYSAEGVPIPGATKTEVEVVNGRDIVLTIDVELQKTVEDTLADKIEQIEAKTGSSVVMDAETGEIYAAASMPTFDIVKRDVIPEGATNINAFSMVYEPGSIFKPVTMLAALQEGTTTYGQIYFCPAELEVDGYSISDAHDREDMNMTSSKIMADSSNVGMSLISRDLGSEAMHSAITSWGVTESTGVDYPGEGSGSISNYSQWSTVQQYNVAFGQGLMTTPISMVRFYGAIANGGVAVTPHFLLEIPGEEEQPTFESKQIFSDDQALSDMVRMLEGVVENGTGTAAQIDGYTIAGKTGTAQIASPKGGYEESLYNISFIGFIPGASTNLVCFVGGGEVPAMRPTVSAFHDIMSFAIDSYGITQSSDGSKHTAAQES